MSINVTHLRSFWHVASHGSFAQAARVLGVSQPTLTRQVAALEAAYRVALLERTTRRIVVTEEGTKLLDICRPIFAGIMEAEEYLRSQDRRTIRVNAVHTACLPDILAAWYTRLPQLRFDVGLSGSPSVLDALLARDCDFGLLTLVDPSDELAWFKAGTGSIVAYVPIGHAWFGRHNISIHELPGAPLLLGSQLGQSRRHFDAVLSAAGVCVEPIQVVESAQLMSDLVSRGVGIAVTPETGHDQLFNVPKVYFDEPEMQMDVHFACRKERLRTSIFRTVFEVAKELSLRRDAS